MPFVKLDCGMLDSTIWVDRDARDIFVTALLMAEPLELESDREQIEVRSLKLTGFIVPVGWYGFVSAAGTGIIRRCGLEIEEGLSALERLGSPDPESRTPDFDGRRLVRIDGGFLVLNFIRYRERDYTAAERSRRYREKKARHAVASDSHAVASRNVTQAEVDAEAIPPKEQTKPVGYIVPICFESINGFSTALAGWIEARKKKRNPATGHAIQLLIDRLAERPSQAVAALNEAAERGWGTVKWEWIDKANGKRPEVRASI